MSGTDRLKPPPDDSRPPVMLQRSATRLVRPERSPSVRRPLIANSSTRPIEYFSRAIPQHAQPNTPDDALPTHTNNSLQNTRAHIRSQYIAADQISPALSEYAVNSNGNDIDGEGQNDKSEGRSVWTMFSRAITCCIPASMLARFGGMSQPAVQQAWREKVALVTIIATMCAILVFLAFGLQSALCPASKDRQPLTEPPRGGALAIHGTWYVFDPQFIATVHKRTTNQIMGNATRSATTRDISYFFPSAIAKPSCQKFTNIPQAPCSVPGLMDNVCHDSVTADVLGKWPVDSQVSFEWDDIGPKNRYNYTVTVFNGVVVDLKYILTLNNSWLLPEMRALLNYSAGTDITRQVMRSPLQIDQMHCLMEMYTVGYMYKKSVGCFASNIITVISLAVVAGMVLVRFIMALIYSLVVAPRMSQTPKSVEMQRKGLARTTAVHGNKRQSVFPVTSRFSVASPPSAPYGKPTPWIAHSSKPASKRNTVTHSDIFSGGTTDGSPFVVMMVTCYSEGRQGIKETLDSLAATDYANRNKLIFLVADGMVDSGERLPGKESEPLYTADICVDLIEVVSEDNEPQNYVAIAEGSKQHNMARVYAGYYVHELARVPVILVVKCGTPAEKSDPKPGNRGKRDSQIIFMNFMSKVMFDDRMSQLEYDIYAKIKQVAFVSPAAYEMVLMVDADTKVQSDALPLLVNALCNDPTIMGICGETRIANKSDSWVTAIQVYEYFVSHHLAKTFESMFGGVTCLPGCFCMYRIKVQKGTGGYWVPVLANPDIVEEYSQNIVDTLHKKNLLSLGEDRFLTTLMLKTFPKRKMMFLPQAVCKTVVPDKFSVLLSQRRRWINSTIHNLLELALVKDLCGIFCFSMQFVVILDLIGTVVLPAAIFLTYAMICAIFFMGATSDAMIALAMLILILFMPAILILIQARRAIYVVYMLVYLLALPVWNFILPVYAFWHFDDFSWGKTRAVAGVEDGDHSVKSGEFDSSALVMKRWQEWEVSKRKQKADVAKGVSQKSDTTPGSIKPALAVNTAPTPAVTAPGYQGPVVATTTEPEPASLVQKFSSLFSAGAESSSPRSPPRPTVPPIKTAEIELRVPSPRTKSGPSSPVSARQSPAGQSNAAVTTGPLKAPNNIVSAQVAAAADSILAAMPMPEDLHPSPENRPTVVVQPSPPVDALTVAVCQPGFAAFNDKSLPPSPIAPTVHSNNSQESRLRTSWLVQDDPNAITGAPLPPVIKRQASNRAKEVGREQEGPKSPVVREQVTPTAEQKMDIETEELTKNNTSKTAAADIQEHLRLAATEEAPPAAQAETVSKESAEARKSDESDDKADDAAGDGLNWLKFW